MTKSELREMVRELLREELAKSSVLTEAVAVAPAEELLATYVATNPEFESACMTGDVAKILSIMDSEMEKQQMFTPGAKKLRDDVVRMAKGHNKVPQRVGEQILFIIWNSQLSGTGNKVIR